MTFHELKWKEIVPIVSELLVQKSALEAQMALKPAFSKRRLLMSAIIQIDGVLNTLAKLKESHETA
jgi:hypothetical protein